MASAYSLTRGDIQCAVLDEGTSTATAAELAGRYPNVSQADIAAALGSAESASSLNVLYLQSQGRHILVDVGFGAGARPAMGQTEASLAEIGLSPADIDIVYLTHFHSDHIDGLVDANGEPCFTQARYMTTQAEWDQWMGRWRAFAAGIDQALWNGYGPCKTGLSSSARGTRSLKASRWSIWKVIRGGILACWWNRRGNV